MRKLAQNYYKNGCNCCESIVMAANKKYNLGISKDLQGLVSGVNNGMGIGCLCGPIIGGVMVIGYILSKKKRNEKNDINYFRMKFINAICNEISCVNCAQITKLDIARGGCTEVVSKIAGILDNVLSECIKS